MAFRRSGRFRVIFAIPGRTCSTTTLLMRLSLQPPRLRELRGAPDESRPSEARTPIAEAGRRTLPLPVVDGPDVGVGAQRREVFEQRGDAPARVERRRETVDPAYSRHVPRARVLGDRVQMAEAREERGGRLRAEAGKAREPIGAVADQGEPVGDRIRRDAELGAHTFRIEVRVL